MMLLTNWSDASLLYERQINPRKHHIYTKIGFSKGALKSFSRFDHELEHSGCVNTVKWNKTGDLLISGSDDRTIKLWSISRSLDSISLKHTVQTKHRGNIFCADISPQNPNCLLSSAADGTLKCSYLDTKHAGSNIFTSEDIIHMFLFDCENPQVVYTAEEEGLIHRIDLRTNNNELIFINKPSPSVTESSLTQFRRANSTPGTVKILTQSLHLGASQLIVGGKGFEIGLLDLRLTSRDRGNGRTTQVNGEEVTAKFNCSDFVKIWSPTFPFPSDHTSSHAQETSSR